jgi:Probable zinc-ribbon domain
MTSKNTKNKRLEESRVKKAKALEGINTCDPNTDPPPNAVIADKGELVHNNTYGPLPSFYLDKVVFCRQCQKEEVWPAKRQKWWYEVAKGDINTQAVLCRSCRKMKKTRKEEARRVHLDGLAKKLGNE